MAKETIAWYDDKVGLWRNYTEKQSRINPNNLIPTSLTANGDQFSHKIVCSIGWGEIQSRASGFTALILSAVTDIFVQFLWLGDGRTENDPARVF